MNTAHPKTPRGVPPSTRRRQHLEFRLPTGSLLAPRPPGRYLVLVPSSYLIPGRKTRGNLVGWQSALIVPPFPSLARPRHPADCPRPTSKGVSAPKPLTPLGRAALVTSLHPQRRTHLMSPSRCHHPQRDTASIPTQPSHASVSPGAVLSPHNGLPDCTTICITNNKPQPLPNRSLGFIKPQKNPPGEENGLKEKGSFPPQLCKKLHFQPQNLPRVPCEPQRERALTARFYRC